jgi:deoxycytidylate deaminase
MNINRLLKIAVNEAKKSTYRYRVGSVIFNKKSVLSKGHNYPNRSASNLHPKFKQWPNSIHAEADAILKAKKKLKFSTILVARINKKDQLVLSKPCKNCMEYIIFTGIKKIIYTTNSFPYLETIKL